MPFVLRAFLGVGVMGHGRSTRFTVDLDSPSRD